MKQTDAICDTMSRKQFFLQAEDLYSAMKRDETFIGIKSLVLVKTYNTLHLSDVYNDVSKKELPGKFIQEFEKKYLKLLIVQLGATYGVGMTVYSKKYDLYIGIGSEFRCRDVYLIAG